MPVEGDRPSVDLIEKLRAFASSVGDRCHHFDCHDSCRLDHPGSEGDREPRWLPIWVIPDAEVCFSWVLLVKLLVCAAVVWLTWLLWLRKLPPR
jgi:hypothetical protein